MTCAEDPYHSRIMLSFYIELTWVLLILSSYTIINQI